MKNAKPCRSTSWTNGFINLGLVLISLAVSYAVLGAFLLVYGPAIAWKPFNRFPTSATIPWQPSGPSTENQPYIAVLGDSLAEGVGDWNFNRTSRAEPYYSGDVISRKLGLPVISFGKNNAGSIDALVTNPGAIMNADSCMLLRSPAKPKSLVVYIYEGNDFDNNIRDLLKAAEGNQMRFRSQPISAIRHVRWRVFLVTST